MIEFATGLTIGFFIGVFFMLIVYIVKKNMYI